MNRPTCPDCGYPENPVTANFCGGCGRRFTQAERPSPQLVGATAAVTSRQLVEQFLDERSELKGAKKLATVLFADTVGSMEKTEGLSTEDVGSFLQPIKALMHEGVKRHEGIVTQVMGDGIMALFGFPIAREDDAVRAACAAIEIQQLFEQARSEGRFQKAREPHIRIGIHSGEVLMTAARNDLSVDLVVEGHTVNIASRIESLAKPGTACLTGQTLRLAEGLIHVQSLGQHLIDGHPAPIDLYELRGETGQSRYHAHQHSPWFLGRDDALDMLRVASEFVDDGGTRTVLIEGEAGIGKSRLCHEFLGRVPAGDFRVLESSAVPFSRSDYGILRQLTLAFLGVTREETTDELAKELNRGLAELGIKEQCHVGLANILGIGTESGEWAELDAIQRRFRQFEALRILIETLGDRSPLLIVCEDLHWIDSQSWEFIQSLIMVPPETPIMLILTYRPEFDNPNHLDTVRGWIKQPQVTFRQLRPLTSDECETLISKFMGNSPELKDLRDDLVRKTDGNPFFIEESIRSLRDRGIVVGDGDDLTLGSVEPDDELPASIEAVVAARIEPLPHLLRQVVDAAAVIGGDMSVEELAEVLGVSVEKLATWIDRLLDLKLMVRIGGDRTSLVRFRHATVQDIAYRKLRSDEKKRLHENAMQALESIYAGRVAEHVDRLADHAFRAEAWKSAVSYNLEACRQAADRSANREAARAMDRGLTALVHVPSSDEWTQKGIDIGLRAMEALLPLGDKGKMVRVLHDAEMQARSIGDERRLAAALTQLATARWINAEHDLSRQSADAALELGKKYNSIGLQNAAWHGIASVLHARAEFAEVIKIEEQLLPDYRNELQYKRFGWPGYPSVFCRTFLGSAYTYIGEFDKAVETFEKGLKIADEVNHPYSQTICREEYGYTLLWLDRVDDALRVLNEALDISRKYDVYTMYPAICGRLALALTAAGRAEEAIDIAEPAAVPRVYERAGRYALNFLLTGLGAAYLAVGRIDDARRSAERVQGKTSLADERAHLACALALRGDIELAGRKLNDAETAYKDGLKIALDTRMRPIEAQCRQGIGEACLRAHRKADARVEIEAAAKLYDEIGLTTRAVNARALLETN